METGRPTKFEKKRTAKILAALKQGATRKTACSHGGVTYRCFLQWLERGSAANEDGEDKDFFHFFHAVELAENYAALKFELLVTKAANEDPKYALEWLKRRRRDEWGDNVRVDVDDEITRLMAGLAAKRQVETS